MDSSYHAEEHEFNEFLEGVPPDYFDATEDEVSNRMYIR